MANYCAVLTGSPYVEHIQFVAYVTYKMKSLDQVLEKLTPGERSGTVLFSLLVLSVHGRPREKLMELHDYLRILYANWVLIVVITLLGAGAGVAVTLFATPQYEAHSRLYVAAQTDSQESGDLLQGADFARQNMTTYVELATTESVLEPVVQQLDLGLSTRQLAEHVLISSPTGSTLMDINVTDEDPARAAAIADEIGAQTRILVEEELAPSQETEAVSPVFIRTVQTADEPIEPVSPRPGINLAVGILLGLAVGVAAALLRTILDTRIRSTEEIERITGAPILGRVAHEAKAKQKPLIIHLDPRSPRAEAFRALRTNVQFLSIADGPETFVVSSSGPGEGKTTTSANLALALAETGLKVALVDCDLRKPRIADYMGLEGAVGLTEVLIGHAELSDVLQQWGTAELYVLPAGRIPPNPSELLGSDSMDRLLTELESRVDVVIVDTPPTLMVTDAVVVGSKTQGIIFVAAAGITKKRSLEASVETFKTAGVRLRGVVATMLPAKGAGAYGSGAYSSSYGDGKATSTTDEWSIPWKSSGRRAQRQ